VSAVLEGTPDRSRLHRVIAVCHGLAVAFLRSKRTVWTLASRNGLAHSDIAYDCIAELFQQDASGGLVQLKAYFDGLPLNQMEDAEVLVHIRRLVFAKVNHGIFRICNEHDPALGKILRNLKLAIHALRNFDEVERFGELWIRPTLADPLEDLPAAGQEELLEALRGSARGAPRIPDLLAALSIYLREQSVHARSVPLMELAVTIRLLFVCTNESQAEPGEESPVSAEDTRSFVREACRTVRTSMSRRYVDRGKVTPATYDVYFAVIEEGLTDRFVGGDGEAFSLYEGLKMRIPDLSRDEYRREYKSHLEYLGRLALREALRKLKKEL
jgi:hypothetical protein